MKFIFSVLFVCGAITLNAQKLINLTPNKSATVQQIVNGLENNFATIKGTQIGVLQNATEYASSVCWTDSAKCTITLYNNAEKKSALSNSSWQAELQAKENFADVAKQYKKVYNQINNASILYSGKKVTLKAKYVAPDEAIGFNSISFEAGDEKKLKVDIILSSEGMEWSIKIQIYTAAPETLEKVN